VNTSVKSKIPSFPCVHKTGGTSYCYEVNDIDVWGPDGDDYDISVTANVHAHNDFYDWPWDPDTELAPVVQCGEDGRGGNSSYMTHDAVAAPPTYEVTHEVDGNDVSISIEATDISGIHYIKYQEDGEVVWHSSPVQNQFPTSSLKFPRFCGHMEKMVFYFSRRCSHVTEKQV
jgi:hypothetical protein